MMGGCISHSTQKLCSEFYHHHPQVVTISQLFWKAKTVRTNFKENQTITMRKNRNNYHRQQKRPRQNPEMGTASECAWLNNSTSRTGARIAGIHPSPCGSPSAGEAAPVLLAGGRMCFIPPCLLHTLAPGSRGVSWPRVPLRTPSARSRLGQNAQQKKKPSVRSLYWSLGTLSCWHLSACL